MRAIPLITAASLSACALGDTVIPAPGVWDYLDRGLIADTCGADEPLAASDATFLLRDPAPDGFTVEEQETFSCSLEGRRFSCPERRREEVGVGGTTIVWSIGVTGRLSTPRRMTGEQTLSATCEGALCGLDDLLLGVSLPCASTMAFDARAR